MIDITKVAYEKYRLDWMLQHNYTLSELMAEMDKMQEESDDLTVTTMFDDWEYEFGFNSEIWVSIDEFIENEFLDIGYMDTLLTQREFSYYLLYLAENESDLISEFYYRPSWFIWWRNKNNFETGKYDMRYTSEKRGINAAKHYYKDMPEIEWVVSKTNPWTEEERND